VRAALPALPPGNERFECRNNRLLLAAAAQLRHLLVRGPAVKGTVLAELSHELVGERGLVETLGWVQGGGTRASKYQGATVIAETLPPARPPGPFTALARAPCCRPLRTIVRRMIPGDEAARLRDQCGHCRHHRGATLRPRTTQTLPRHI